jgi:hypothetical protein
MYPDLLNIILVRTLCPRDLVTRPGDGAAKSQRHDESLRITSIMKQDEPKNN